jgi:hypothetical protein
MDCLYLFLKLVYFSSICVYIRSYIKTTCIELKKNYSHDQTREKMMLDSLLGITNLIL